MFTSLRQLFMLLSVNMILHNHFSDVNISNHNDNINYMADSKFEIDFFFFFFLLHSLYWYIQFGPWPVFVANQLQSSSHSLVI